MVHPLVPVITDLATPVAVALELEIVQVVFHTNQFPPVLRIDIRPCNRQEATSHAHCEQFSQALELHLDAADVIPGQYILEISSPGVGRDLVSDRDFTVFKGFPVSVTTDPPHKGQSQWTGNLVQRDPDQVILSRKGRRISIPLGVVQRVELLDGDL
ncbi:MAG: ribosome maturation factor RimP [Thermostichales cyanobacterium SZTDM-1c_bins_54]